jgi:hypothetical protein
MELGSFMTTFYADTEVEVGKIAVYSPKRYGDFPEYVMTLNHPADPFDPWESH